jgi:uncharacterized protein YndB with AHSA1/START domain
MERKTKITAEDGKQELLITREFDLPLELLFRAHVDPEVIQEWMGTKVVKLETRKHGSWQFETADAQGNVLFRANGVIHEFVPNQKITRTFEMENTPFGVQLEFVEFEKISDEASKIKIHIVYRSAAIRDEMLKMGMSQGMNMAHNRLQSVASKLKSSV